ncbi:MAG TPA: hypothetical protein V6D08_12820, partial [Candidatus Obscuribacterales bacterium]
RQGRPVEALAMAEQALAANDQFAMAHLLKVNTLTGLQRASEAEAHLSGAFARHPLNLPVNDIYVDFLISHGKPAAALEPALCSFAVSAALNTGAGRERLVGTLLAASSRRAIRRALAATDGRLDSVPGKRAYHLAVADLLDKVTFFDLAAAEYRAAAALAPADARLYERVGDYLEEKLRAHGQALALYRQAQAGGARANDLEAKIARVAQLSQMYEHDLISRASDDCFLAVQHWLGNVRATPGAAPPARRPFVPALTARNIGVLAAVMLLALGLPACLWRKARAPRTAPPVVPGKPSFGRRQRGHALSEFGPALMILLCLGFFPLIDFISVGLQYSGCWYLNFLQTREAALTIKITEGKVDGGSMEVARRRAEELRRAWRESGIGKFCNVDQDKPFEQSINIDSSGGPAATFVRVTTRVSCYPFLPIPFIPGLNKSFSFALTSERLVEDVSG